MSGLLPAAVYGLEVPSGDIMIPARPDFPAAFRITMAALDPTAPPEFAGTIAEGSAPRATLKILRQPIAPSYSDTDSETDNLEALLNGSVSDEDEDSDDSEANGGPSDPTKSKKARREAAMDSLRRALAEGAEEDLAAAKTNKGKAKATDLDDDDSESTASSEDLELEEYVICTLDPNSHYQQPLDVTVGEDEDVFFKVTGTHTIFLTGNYVIPVDDTPRGMYDEDDEDEYDLSPDEDELLDDEDEESDELDDVPDPKIMEVDSEDDEVPKLVTKGKNKRPASDSEEDGATLDAIISKAFKSEANGEKLSKKQQKKLKNNAGTAVTSTTDKAETESPAGKKVSFAKNLEQGPTGSQAAAEKKVNGTAADKSAAKESKAKGEALGVTMVRGVKIDVKKLGSGPTAKKGDTIGMRYIGKTTKDNKQFDANKKGKPFYFKLGTGEVIQGWDIGVEGIRVGGERRIIIPAPLAYGKKSMPGIPANSELTFDIKCLEIK